MANMVGKVTMRNPKSFGTNSLRYFVKGGTHFVIHDMNCGEDIAPDIYRHDNYAAALVTWNRLLARLIDRGYVEREV